MLIISLTSIPPRYGQLPRVLHALRAQGADRVALVIPHTYARFAQAPLPALPDGVELLQTGTDLGPAGKLLAPAAAYPGADILYCDDDWLYGPGWADALRAARAPNQGSDRVVAASTWATERIGHMGGTVAQGFAGVLVAADRAARIPPPPPEAWAADDIWLSGWFAGLGLAVTEAPAARGLATPLADPGALQDSTDRDGANRDGANRAAAALIQGMFGTWPAG